MANIDIANPGANATALRAALAKQGAGAIAQDATPQSITGTLTETTLATITIPGGLMGANGQVEIVAFWSFTSSANIKTLKVKFGAATIQNSSQTTNTVQQTYLRVANRNSAASQVAFVVGATSGLGATGGAVVTAANDTASDVQIQITGQLANTGETITLESYIVKLFPKA